jgi:hypothetical protein
MNSAAPDRAASEKGDGSGAMIGANRSVDLCGPAKFRYGDDSRVLPLQAEPSLEFLDGDIKARKPRGKLSGRPAFIGMHVPAVEGQRRDKRPIAGGHQFC